MLFACESHLQLQVVGAVIELILLGKSRPDSQTGPHALHLAVGEGEKGEKEEDREDCKGEEGEQEKEEEVHLVDIYQ